MHARAGAKHRPGPGCMPEQVRSTDQGPDACPSRCEAPTRARMHARAGAKHRPGPGCMPEQPEPLSSGRASPLAPAPPARGPGAGLFAPIPRRAAAGFPLRSLTRREGGKFILQTKRVLDCCDPLTIELHPQYVVNEKGQKKAVILPVEEYEELLEDLSDLAIAAERREEGTVSHEQILKAQYG